MINILLNAMDFDGSWAYSVLSRYLKPHMKAVILPLSFHEGWLADEEEWRRRYKKGTDDYELLVRPFRSYFINDADITWINDHEDDPDTALMKLRDADIIYLAGAYPDWMMGRIEDLDLLEPLRNFDGIIMGSQAGALIQLDQYHMTRDESLEFGYGDGLGLLSGFDVENQFEASEEHLEAIIRSIEDRGNPVVCCPGQSGLLVRDGNYELLGRAFTADTDNLDDLYAALEDSRTPYMW